MMSLVCRAVSRALFLSSKYKSVGLDHAANPAAGTHRQPLSRVTGRFFNRVLRVSHYGVFMNVTLSLGPLVSLIAGILILVMPRLLNYIVALYLIIIGIIGIFGVGSSHF
jgi:hypothetical protein